MGYLTIKDMETVFRKKFRASKQYLTTAHAEIGKRRLYALVRAYGYAAEAEMALDLLPTSASVSGDKRREWEDNIVHHIYAIEEELGI